MLQSGIRLLSTFLLILSLSSCSSQYPKVSGKKFKELSSELTEAIKLSKENTKSGIENLEAMELLPRLLENRKNYILGRLYKKISEKKKALDAFLKVDPNYLSEYKLWQASLLAKDIGREDVVVKNLTRLVKKHPNNPKYKYELAKSNARQSLFNNARLLFKNLQRKFPESEYAIGANYYLGNLSGSKRKQLEYFEKYLEKSPMGSFASLVSNQIIKLANLKAEELRSAAFKIEFSKCESCTETLDSETKFSCEEIQLDCSKRQEPKLSLWFKDSLLSASHDDLKDLSDSFHHLKIKLLVNKFAKDLKDRLPEQIALSYFASENYKKANKHFPPKTKYWFEKSKALAKLRRANEAKRLLVNRIKVEEDEELAKQALDYLLTLSPRWEEFAFLKELIISDSPIKDKIQWHIALISSTSVDYKKVYENYPESFYAAESMARVFWNKYTDKKYPEALEIAEKHWELYGDTRSHPMVAFWAAKAEMKEDDPGKAKSRLKDLIKAHPRDYYSYRAESLLKSRDLNDGDWYKLGGSNSFIALKDWNWPKPYTDKQIKSKYGKDILELTKIQEFDYILALEEEGSTNDKPNSFDDKFKMWLYAMDENNLKAISTAYFSKDKSLNEELKDEYSYPLLYSELVAREIFEKKSSNGKKLEAKIDPMLAHALIKQESRYQKEIVSKVGAIGLMQLMPYTAKIVARTIGERIPRVEDLRNPEVNIKLGVAYMEEVFGSFNNNMIFAIASYNAGPAAVRRWDRKFKGKDYDLFIEEIPYNETRNYVKKVLANYWIYQELYS